MTTLKISSAKDIEQFIESRPSSGKTWLLAMVALGGIFVDAYDFASLGVGIVQLREQFALTALQEGGLTAIMAFGACLGGIVGGRYIDRIGRFKILIINVALLVFAAIGAALSVNYAMLLAFRFLMGIGVGLDFPVALSYVAEIVNKKQKNSGVSAWQIMWYVAATCSGLVILPLNSELLGEHLWRYAVGFGAIPAFIILLLRYFIADESPLWAAKNLPLEQAAKIVAKTYNVEIEITPNAIDNHKTLAIKSSTRELFSGRYLRRTMLASLVCITQAVEYFSVGFNLPSISEDLFGKGISTAIMGAILFNLFGIVGATVGAYLVGRTGVRRLAIFGYIIVAVCLLLLGLKHDTLTTYEMAGLLGTMLFGHSIGPGQGMSLATLSYPIELRGAGSGWGQGMARTGSILGFFLFPLVMSSHGMATTMLVIAVVPVIGLISCLSLRGDPTHDAAKANMAYR